MPLTNNTYLFSVKKQPNQNSQSQTQPNQPQTPQQQQQQWSQSAIQARLSAQQQQNPMLNAQLQVSKSFHSSPSMQWAPHSLKLIGLPSTMQQSGYNNLAAARQFQAQRQRSLQSPGAQTLRQNSFSEGSFQEPPSPTTQNTYAPNMFNTQQMRLARQQSIPNATQHLPGK